jgi:hypothetical protein
VLPMQTALHEHDLLSRPWQPIQFAVDRRLFVARLGDRPVEAHVESAERLVLGAEPFGPSSISSVERALLESPQRPRLVGGIATVAEAFHARGESMRRPWGVSRAVGLRRRAPEIVTLNRGLGLHSLDELKIPPVEVREIPLDPTDRRTEGHFG